MVRNKIQHNLAFTIMHYKSCLPVNTRIPELVTKDIHPINSVL